MNIFEKYGVKTLINVDGPLTRFGGSFMEQNTLDAFVEAAGYSVRLDELQAAASKVIAKRTHAEAGIVTNGTAAAMTLATAACLCGFDTARMEALPDTSRMPNEVLMPWHQISGYDHAIRAAGARLVGFGVPHSTPAPFATPKITRWHLEAAISKETVAVFYAVRTDSHPPLADVIEVAHKYGVPVVVDAGPEVPPVENLYKFIDMGADLVCFSGGKGLRGPQQGGLLYGKKDLIASAFMQMLEAPAEEYPDWNPPAALIDKSKFRSTPNHGIGRGLKVSKETIAAMLTALDNLDEEKFEKTKAEKTALLESIRQTAEAAPGIQGSFVPLQYCLCEYPTLDLKLEAGVAKKDAATLVKELIERGIYPRDRCISEGIVRIYSINLTTETAAIVGDAIYDIMK